VPVGKDCGTVVGSKWTCAAHDQVTTANDAGVSPCLDSGSVNSQ
jgi:hypothetical protein